MSAPHWKYALDKGNRIRSEGRALKEAIARGDVNPLDVIAGCHLPIRASALVGAIPGVGETKSDLIFDVSGVNPGLLFARRSSSPCEPVISPIQRQQLALAVEMYAPDRALAA